MSQTKQDHVVIDILQEREHQDQEWGGPSHDDQHNVADWLDFIEKQILKIRHERHAEERTRLVKIGALAVASIMSYDRRRARLMKDLEDAKPYKPRRRLP